MRFTIEFYRFGPGARTGAPVYVTTCSAESVEAAKESARHFFTGADDTLERDGVRLWSADGNLLLDWAPTPPFSTEPHESEGVRGAERPAPTMPARNP